MAGLWGLSIFVTLIAVAALVGASVMFVVGALWVLWFAVALYLLRRQVLLREAAEPNPPPPVTVGRTHEHRKMGKRPTTERIHGTIAWALWGAFIGLFLTMGALVLLEESGAVKPWGNRSAGVPLIVGPSIGALGGAILGFYLLRGKALVQEGTGEAAKEPSVFRVVVLGIFSVGYMNSAPLSKGGTAVGEELLICGLGLYFLFPGQALFREAVARVNMRNVHFGIYVLWGAVFGGLLALSALSHLLTIEGFERFRMLIGMCLVGATVGALFRAFALAYRIASLGLLTLLWLSGPAKALTWFLDHDWGPVHLWGWIWVTFSVASLSAAMLAPAILANFGFFRKTPALVFTVAVLLGTGGAMVFGAVLLGQIGRQINGQQGFEVGQTLGGLLGPFVGWLTISPFFTEGPGRHSWDICKARHWIGLVVAVALANGGVLWLLMAGEPRGVDVRQVSSDGASSEAVFGVALSPDNSLAISAEAGALPLWKKAEASELRRISIHQVSASDRYFEEKSSIDPNIRLWDLSHGKELGRLKAPEHDMAICSFAIAPEGGHVLAGSLDGTLRLWELATGKEVWQDEHL
jgi:hypothetical protein